MKGSDFDIRDPDFEVRVRASFERQGLMRALGAELTRVGPGLVEIDLPFTDALTQQNGYFHAGAVASIVDSAGGYAASTLLAPGEEVLTVEFKLNLMAPAEGDLARAVGKVVRAGKTLSVTSGEVFVRNGGTFKPCALMQQTVMRIV